MEVAFISALGIFQHWIEVQSPPLPPPASLPSSKGKKQLALLSSISSLSPQIASISRTLLKEQD